MKKLVGYVQHYKLVTAGDYDLLYDAELLSIDPERWGEAQRAACVPEEDGVKPPMISTRAMLSICEVKA